VAGFSAVAGPLFGELRLLGLFVDSIVGISPTLLALADANLRHFNVRICEQGIGAGAWEFPFIAQARWGKS
jgi:hypothetical protein